MHYRTTPGAKTPRRRWSSARRNHDQVLLLKPGEKVEF